MSEKSKYFLFLIEQYALYKGISGKQVLDLFIEKNLIEYIYNMYYTYHTERIENAFEDLDSRLSR